MVRIVIIILFYILSIFRSCAQDPVFSSGLEIPQTLNPAFIGLSEINSVGLIHRFQWPNLDLKISSDFAFLNTWNESINSSIAVSFVSQRQNFSNFNLSQVDLSYSYRVQLTDEWVFHPAIQIGRGSRSVSYSSIFFEDQIDIVNDKIHTLSSEFSNNIDSRSFFDFTAGMLINTDSFYIGASLKHLNKPNVSFIENNSMPLDMLFSVNTGYKFLIADYVDILLFPYETKLKITSNYINQGSLKRINFGVAMDFSNFYFGLSGDSNLKLSQGNTSTNRLGLFGGLNYDQFQFGFNYDFNRLKSLNTGGVYEFFILYRFDLFENCNTCPRNSLF